MEKKWRFFLCVAMLLFCSGCMFTDSLDGLYQLPQLPAEYMELEQQITSIVTGGAESTAPAYGPNIQSVQLVDLNNDGVEEAVAFFHNTSDERPLKIYIFTPENGHYVQAAMIEGVGSSIYSIRYEDMDEDGFQEMIVGWRSDADVLSLSVYSIYNFKPRLLLSSGYSRLAVADLKGDGKKELVLVRSDAEAEAMVAECYGWGKEDELTLLDSCKLSMTVSELNRVSVGGLENGQNALFVSGVQDGSYLVVDVLKFSDGELSSITADSRTGASPQYLFYNLYPRDINGDGVMEVPQAREVYNRTADGYVNSYYLVYWLRFGVDGTASCASITYYDAANGWYLDLPSAWLSEQLLIRSNNLISNESSVTFAVGGSGRRDSEIVTIYILRGSAREKRALIDGRNRLGSMAETVYAYSLPQRGSNNFGNNALSVDEITLKRAFHLITTEWTVGDT